MNKEKLLYEAPTAQTFVIRFEGVICQSTGEQVADPQDWTGIDDWA